MEGLTLKRKIIEDRSYLGFLPSSTVQGNVDDILHVELTCEIRLGSLVFIAMYQTSRKLMRLSKVIWFHFTKYSRK